MTKRHLKSILGLAFMSLFLLVFAPTDTFAQREVYANNDKTETRAKTSNAKTRAKTSNARTKAKPVAINRERAATPVKQYSNQPRRGARVNTLPQRTAVVRHRNSNYHYRDGIFYRGLNGSFTIIAPPIGIHISILPADAYRVILSGRSYYYYYGTYYSPLRNGRGYEVVSPPVGARVDALPEGYEVFELDGMIYYRLDETFYKAVLEPNGYVVYEVVRV